MDLVSNFCSFSESKPLAANQHFVSSYVCARARLPPANSAAMHST